jgi:hypothetical protein
MLKEKAFSDFMQKPTLTRNKLRLKEATPNITKKDNIISYLDTKNNDSL